MKSGSRHEKQPLFSWKKFMGPPQVLWTVAHLRFCLSHMTLRDLWEPSPRQRVINAIRTGSRQMLGGKKNSLPRMTLPTTWAQKKGQWFLEGWNLSPPKTDEITSVTNFDKYKLYDRPFLKGVGQPTWWKPNSKFINRNFPTLFAPKSFGKCSSSKEGWLFRGLLRKLLVSGMSINLSTRFLFKIWGLYSLRKVSLFQFLLTFKIWSQPFIFTKVMGFNAFKVHQWRLQKFTKSTCKFQLFQVWFWWIFVYFLNFFSSKCTHFTHTRTPPQRTVTALAPPQDGSFVTICMRPSSQWHACTVLPVFHWKGFRKIGPPIWRVSPDMSVLMFK